jgi:protein involved in polysaccharide export with SLBB domain
VIHPGRYEVSIQTDLVQLLSYAGGPGPDAKMASVKITRFIRTDNGLSKSENFVNLENLYRVNDAQLILQPGDTIFIDQTSWTTLRDVLTVIGSAVVVAATVSTVIYNSHH